MTIVNDTETVDLDAIDFTAGSTFDNPWAMYSALRALPTLYYDKANDLYIAARHEDVFAMSRDSETYCSKYGVRPKIAGDMSIITLDGDEHVRQRRLINKGFTPRRVRDLMPHIRELSQQIAADIADKETVDFVEDFAMHVPLIVIAEMMGLDPEQRDKMYRWSDAMMAGDGHVEADDPVLHEAAAAFGEYCEMCIGLIAERREDPKDDLISVLTTAFDEGLLEKEHLAYQGVDEETLALTGQGTLDDEELLGFLTILLVAGNETTRNAISGGLLALSLFPEQKQLMLDNLNDEAFMDLAVDELVRYVVPVIGFIRTVTVDHTYRGTDLKEGDRVLMLYGSANRDEAVFDKPDQLDLTRDPNPHLGFGIGPHFCLGANLARFEIKLVFQELLARLPNIVVDDNAPFERGDSSLVLSLQHLPAHPGGCPVPH